MNLSILTLNALAPIYKRLNPVGTFQACAQLLMSELVKSNSSYQALKNVPQLNANDFGNRYLRMNSLLQQKHRSINDVNHPNDGTLYESSSPAHFVPRHSAIASLLASVSPSIICLQEVWFQSQFLDLYYEKLKNYTFILKLRLGNKQDGLAICVRDDITVLDVQEMDFDDLGSDRVAQMVLVSCPGECQARRQCLVVNTHLTFPHHARDVETRGKQAKKLVNWIEEYTDSHGLAGIPIFLAGDFNGNHDNVTEVLNHAGFLSTYFMVNQREPGVTHLNHRKQEVATDFIFMKNYAQPPRSSSVSVSSPLAQRYYGTNASPSLVNQKHLTGINHFNFLSYKPFESFLLPKGCSDAVWPNKEWLLSDHRPVVARFSAMPARL